MCTSSSSAGSRHTRRSEHRRDPRLGRAKLAVLAFWHVADQFLPELRAAAPSARVVVDSIDLHFVREVRDELRFEPGSPPGQLSADHGDAFMRELNTYAAADAVLTVSDKEASLINDLVGQPGLALSLPDTEELPRSPVPLHDSRGILFLGNFQHAPNRDAAAYLCGEIVPASTDRCWTKHAISIVGTAADKEACEPRRQHPRCQDGRLGPFGAPVPESAQHLGRPARYGAGTKRKVIQSLMVGTPTVTTGVGAEGLGVRRRPRGRCRRRAARLRGRDRAAAAATRASGSARSARPQHVLELHGRAAVEARFDQVLDEVLARPRPSRLRRLRPRGGGAEPTRSWSPGLPDRRESSVPLEAQVLVASRATTRCSASTSGGAGTSRATPTGVRGPLPGRQRRGDRPPRGAAGAGGHASRAAPRPPSGGSATTKACASTSTRRSGGPTATSIRSSTTLRVPTGTLRRRPRPSGSMRPPSTRRHPSS